MNKRMVDKVLKKLNFRESPKCLRRMPADHPQVTRFVVQRRWINQRCLTLPPKLVVQTTQRGNRWYTRANWSAWVQNLQKAQASGEYKFRSARWTKKYYTAMGTGRRPDRHCNGPRSKRHRNRFVIERLWHVWSLESPWYTGRGNGHVRVQKLWTPRQLRKYVLHRSIVTFNRYGKETAQGPAVAEIRFRIPMKTVPRSPGLQRALRVELWYSLRYLQTHKGLEVEHMLNWPTTWAQPLRDLQGCWDIVRVRRSDYYLDFGVISACPPPRELLVNVAEAVHAFQRLGARVQVLSVNPTKAWHFPAVESLTEGSTAQAPVEDPQ